MFWTTRTERENSERVVDNKLRPGEHDRSPTDESWPWFFYGFLSTVARDREIGFDVGVQWFNR
jgi:hypothetical protein